jgi:predicted transglutaminase-like cysteine proteinase
MALRKLFQTFLFCALFMCLAVVVPSRAKDVASQILVEDISSPEPFGFAQTYCTKIANYCDLRDLQPLTLKQTLRQAVEQTNASVNAKSKTIGISVPYAIAEYAAMEKARLIQNLGVKPSNLLVTLVADGKNKNAKIFVLTLVMQDGDLILSPTSDAITPWDKTDYTFLMRQTQKRADFWVTLKKGLPSEKKVALSPEKTDVVPVKDVKDEKKKVAKEVVTARKLQISGAIPLAAVNCSPLVVSRSAVDPELPYTERLKAQEQMFGGVRNQGNSSTCYAHVAADMMLFNSPEGTRPISALALTLAYKSVYKERETDRELFATGGNVADTIEAAKSYRLENCSEARFATTKLNVQLVEEFAGLRPDQVGRKAEILRSLGVSDARWYSNSLFQPRDSDRRLLLLNALCNLMPGPKPQYTAREYSTFRHPKSGKELSDEEIDKLPKSKRRQYNKAEQILSSALDNGDLPGISFGGTCLNFFNAAGGASHSVTVVERRPQINGKGCLYRTRNSWGNTHQGIWLSSDDIAKCVRVVYSTKMLDLDHYTPQLSE